MDISIKAEVAEVEAQLAYLGKCNIAKKILKSIASKGTPTARKGLRNYLKSKSGNLKKNMKGRVTKRGDAVSFYSDANRNGFRYPFALAAFSTIPYKKGGKVLAFKGKDGNTVYSKKAIKVKSRDYLTPTMKRFIASKEYKDAIELAIKKVVEAKNK